MRYSLCLRREILCIWPLMIVENLQPLHQLHDSLTPQNLHVQVIEKHFLNTSFFLVFLKVRKPDIPKSNSTNNSVYTECILTRSADICPQTPWSSTHEKENPPSLLPSSLYNWAFAGNTEVWDWRWWEVRSDHFLLSISWWKPVNFTKVSGMVWGHCRFGEDTPCSCIELTSTVQ